MKLGFVHLLVFILALAFSLPTLWLLESDIKYPLFFFEIALIALMTARYIDSPRLSFTSKFSLSFETIDCFFLLVSMGMLLTVFFNLKAVTNIILAVVTTSFLPGYVFLRTTRLLSLFSRGEKVVLSYVLSLTFTSFFSSLLLPIASNLLAICLVYLLFSLIPIVTKRFLILRSRTLKPSVHSHNLIETFLLISLVLFFLLWIRTYYPQMAYLPGLDIVRHFANAATVGKTPGALWSPYPWFTVYEAVLYELSMSPMATFQSSLACLSFVVIFAFYIMSKAYLEEIDKRLPIITTVCWSIFSGFGWFYFVVNKPTLTNLSSSVLLYFANQNSYWDIHSSLELWLWFRPITIGFAILFVLLYLLRRFDIPKWGLRALFFLLVTALALFHFSELMLFVVSLAFIAILYPKIRLRVRDAVMSTTIGIVSAFLICCYLNMTAGTVRLQSYAFLVLILPNIVTYPFLSSRWNGLHKKRYPKPCRFVAACFLVLYVGGLFAWMFSDEMFSPQSVQEILFVPWLLYPVLLGVIGLLCLIHLLTARNPKELRSDTPKLFVSLMLIALVLSRGVSILNLNLFQVEFHERRSILYVAMAASMIAFSTIVKKDVHNPMERVTKKRAFLSTLCIGSIVFCGMASTLLCADFWGNAVLTSCPDESEMAAMTFLSSVLEKDPQSPVFTVTSRSTSILDFAGVRTNVDYFRNLLWSSERQEMPLMILLGQKYKATYIYLHKRDIDVLNDTSEAGYVWNHVLSYVPQIFNDSTVRIYEMPSGVPPSLDGNTVLLMPCNNSLDSRLLFACDILSLGNYSFTTRMDSDYMVLQGDYIVLASDRSALLMDEILDGLRTQAKTIIILNTDGYGPFADMFFGEDSPQETFEASRIEGPEYVVHFPFDVRVDHVVAGNNVEVLCWYKNSEESTPFTARCKVGEGNLVYVNVHPLVRRISSDRDARSLYAILKDVLKVADLGLPMYDSSEISWFWDDNVQLLIFRQATLTGIVEASSRSMFLNNTEMLLEEVQIVGDSINTVLQNVNRLVVADFEEAVVSSSRVETGGLMFYMRLETNGSDVFLSGANISLSIGTLHENPINITSRGELKLSIKGRSQIFLFRPKMKCLGNASFREAYAVHPGINRLRTLGQDLVVEGNIEFDLSILDSHSVATGLVFDGSYSRNPPILEWNELDSIKDSIEWIVVSVFIILPILIGRRIFDPLRKRGVRILKQA